MSLTKIRLHLDLTAAQAETAVRMVKAGEAMWRMGVVKRLADLAAGRPEAFVAPEEALVREVMAQKSIRPWMSDIPAASLVMVLRSVEKAFRDHRDFGRGTPDPGRPLSMCFFPTVDGFQVDLDHGRCLAPFLGDLAFQITWNHRGQVPVGNLWRAKIHRDGSGWFLTLYWIAVPALLEEVA